MAIDSRRGWRATCTLTPQAHLGVGTTALADERRHSAAGTSRADRPRREHNATAVTVTVAVRLARPTLRRLFP